MSTIDATAIFLAGVEAVKPEHFIPMHVRVENDFIIIAGRRVDIASVNRVFLVAAGKAASSMALETEKIVGSHIDAGIVVTKYHHALPLRICKTIEAGHPVPDENSIAGGKAVVEIFKDSTPDDLIIMLVSGGASALLADWPPGCTLEDVQLTVQALLNCGAAIDEVNTIRKHLSLIKGGQLMHYTAATVIALLISDVPGDDLSVIASGLTVADNTGFEDAWHIIQYYQLMDMLPGSVVDWLRQGVEKKIKDTPRQGDKCFEKVYNKIVATNEVALQAAARKASSLGYDTHVLMPPMSGEASLQAKYFTEQLKQLPGDQPGCLLWGGETTVTVKGSGRGGRNQEFVLAALCHLQKELKAANMHITILSGGTDGTDGPTDAAGAVIDNASFTAMPPDGIDAEQYLLNNDAYSFFKQTGSLIITGPTQTNVMDIVVGLINMESIAKN
ncbi:MAG: DUF4147 domain-containing protein [Sphingobacteriales bacterium]|nr:DUF4147 domain-containing protein [Sphingobacteriales bacterium]OJY86782.1 MAG: hypothetical protein BGP14_18235 [Sphingobacteriales bacterium 44-15]